MARKTCGFTQTATIFLLFFFSALSQTPLSHCCSLRECPLRRLLTSSLLTDGGKKQEAHFVPSFPTQFRSFRGRFRPPGHTACASTHTHEPLPAGIRTVKAHEMPLFRKNRRGKKNAHANENSVLPDGAISHEWLSKPSSSLRPYFVSLAPPHAHTHRSLVASHSHAPVAGKPKRDGASASPFAVVSSPGD